MAIRLVVADDHPLILNALSSLFLLEGDFDTVAACTDGAEALEAVRLHRPDVAVLDVRMPHFSGLEVAKRIREEKLPVRVVLLTGALDESEMVESLRLKIEGIVLKEMAPHLLVQCVRKVHAGGEWTERRSAKQALENMLRRETGAREVAAVLTPREVELVRMIGHGLRNSEIAVQLFISEGTVKVHLHNIYEKVQVNGRLALMRYAQDKGLA